MSLSMAEIVLYPLNVGTRGLIMQWYVSNFKLGRQKVLYRRHHSIPSCKIYLLVIQNRQGSKLRFVEMVLNNVNITFLCKPHDSAMVLVLAQISVSWNPSGQTKDYKFRIYCFSVKHAALRSKNKDWLARYQVSEWSDMSTRWLSLSMS